MNFIHKNYKYKISVSQFPQKVRKKCIWSPADYVRLPTDKGMISL